MTNRRSPPCSSSPTGASSAAPPSAPIGERTGEVVFNTSMAATRRSRPTRRTPGQIVCMTYPLIGNTGVNLEDPEAARPWIEGLIVRELSPVVSATSARAGTSTATCAPPGSSASRGSTRAASCGGCASTAASTASSRAATRPGEPRSRKAKAAPDMNGLDLVKVVSLREAPRAWTEGYARRPAPRARASPPASKRYPVVAMDFGMKRNILRSLVAAGFDPWVVPATDDAPTAILERKPAGRVPLERPRRPRGGHVRDRDDQGAPRQGARSSGSASGTS